MQMLVFFSVADKVLTPRGVDLLRGSGAGKSAIAFADGGSLLGAKLACPGHILADCRIILCVDVSDGAKIIAFSFLRPQEDGPVAVSNCI